MESPESNSPESTDPPRGALAIAPGVWAPPGGFRVTFARSGGPGGQAVNKLNTRATLRVKISAIVGLHHTAATRLRRLAGARLTLDDEIVLHADASRSQRQNRTECEDRFREMAVKAMKPPKKRRPTKPTKAARERRLTAKRERGETKRQRRGPGDE
jgi:ribosome-associated protein